MNRCEGRGILDAVCIHAPPHFIEPVAAQFRVIEWAERRTDGNGNGN
jgi:hypothetical protein